MGSWGERDLAEIKKIVKESGIANEHLLDIAFSMRESPSIRQLYKMNAMVGILASRDHSMIFAPDKYTLHASMIADAMMLEDEEFLARDRSKNKGSKDEDSVVKLVEADQG